MNSFLERIAKLPPNKLALLAAELHERLEAEQAAAHQPLAIVGIGCRFPGGVDSLQAFGQMLANGSDAISEVDSFRWDGNALYDPNPDAPGKASSKWGGFLPGIDLFDAGFFGIAPREAERLDPQHRLLLETAWEALENACIPPLSLAGSNTGVFLGISNNDYGAMLLGMASDALDGYTASGAAHSIAAGRLSYLLGLKGPSLAIDTACSSSGVAIHLACQSLRRKECDLVLAGGVNIILLPETTIALSKSHMLAPDGRCKTFSAQADGFVRSEGCGLLALKRLSDARAAGDNILGVIRGSACNQDGRSSGLTAPNGPSQEAVIRAALQDAGLQPDDVGYLEAHGTGTALGDPIEVGALSGVFRNRLVIGSVKANIGHLESAAAVAGLAKVLTAFEREEIPPHLHAAELNPHIEWNKLPFLVPQEKQHWLRTAKPRVAGVSSFGFSGTNVHLVVEEPPLSPASSPTRRPQVLVLSAKTLPAFDQLRDRYAAYLEAHPDTDLADFCYSLATGRSHFGVRFASVVGSLPEALEALRSASGAAVERGLGEAPLSLADRADLLSEQYQRGFHIDWTAIYAGERRTKLRLPTYAFQGERHWITPAAKSVPVREEWLYEVAWQPLASARHGAASPVDVAKRMSARAPQLNSVPELAGYEHFQTEIDRLCLDYIVAAFRELDFDQARILPRHARLWARMQQIYELAGGSAYQAANPAERLARLKTAFPQFAGELGFIEQAQSLGQVLQGKTDPLQLLFPEGSLALAERVYAESPVARIYNDLVAHTAADIAQAGSKLRILEIGAGTGSTTAALLPLLAGVPYEYLFTDVSNLFLLHGQTKFAAYPAVQFAVLDIEQGGSSRLGEFDLVIASNVLHATADLRQTLRQVRELLAPAGRLVLLEGTKPQAFGDLTVGMTEGWWRFRDSDLRSSYPLLSRDRWLKLLEEEHFTAAALDPNSAEPFWDEQSVFVAVKRPEAKSFSLVGGSAGVAERVADRLRASGHSLAPTADSVVYFAVPLEDTAAEAVRVSAELLTLLQSEPVANGQQRLWVITQGTQAVMPGEPVSFAGAALWGMLRTAALEHPALRCHAVDIDHASSEALAGLLATGIDPAERQLALRLGKIHTARLSRPTLRALKTSVALSGAHLITGAYGGLGPEVARWLADSGAEELFLVGRRAPQPGVRQSLEALAERGVAVHLLKADVSDRAQMTEVFSQIASSAHRLRGVFHLAGSLQDKTIQQQEAAFLSQVFAAKVQGALLLEELSRPHPIAHFVLFGSAASIMGSAGQANHAAANACLDALAYKRSASGLPALSIAWGPWSEIGAATAYAPERGEARGVSLISPVEGIALLAGMVQRTAPQLAVLPIEWRAYLDSMHSAPSHFLERLAARVPLAGEIIVATEQVDFVIDPATGAGCFSEKVRVGAGQRSVAPACSCRHCARRTAGRLRSRFPDGFRT